MSKLEVRGDDNVLLNTYESEGALDWWVADSHNLVIRDEGAAIAEYRSYHWSSVQYLDEE